jgi:hypothetical protein
MVNMLLFHEPAAMMHFTKHTCSAKLPCKEVVGTADNPSASIYLY